MPSSSAWARAATGLAGALLTFGTATGIVGSTALGPHAAGAAAADGVDPLAASAREVRDELARLDAAVAATRTAAADADATVVDARADLDTAEARVERDRQSAAALEREQARQVEPPTTDVFDMLGAGGTGDGSRTGDG